MQNGRGCYYCGRELTRKAHILDIETNKEECLDLCIKKGVQYIGNYKENGNIFIQYICPYHTKAGIQVTKKGNMKKSINKGCPYCFERKNIIFSKGERKVKDILESMNICYLRQYTFDDCRDINKLPFDYYLPNINKCIEYDGEQHFFPVNFNGISDEETEKKFLITINHDQIKDTYCKNHNIDLLRIPYYDFENMENIIKNFLKNI